MAVLLVFGLFVLTVLLILYFIRKHFSVWKDMHAPNEEPHLFYGNLKGIGKEKHAMEHLKEIYDRHKYTDPFVGIYFFFKPAALLIDLDLIKAILIKDFNNFQSRALYYNEKDDPLSAHMFHIHGAKWKTLRMKLSPTFTSGKMKMMFPTLIEISKHLEDRISDFCVQECEVEIKQLMARYTTDVIGTVAFGIDCNSLKEENNIFHEKGKRIFEKQRYNTFVQLLLASVPNFARKLGIKRLHDDVSEFFMDVIRGVVDHRIAHNEHRKDFMDLFIELYQSKEAENISFNDLAATAFVFFAAGFETSSALLQFCLFELASHPAIQKKTRDHIEEVVAKNGGQFTYEAMMDMKYVDQVLNETLRLYPPIGTLLREAEDDYQVPGTNFVFKKGTLAVIPAFAIQRDPRIYEDADTFNPENFSEEKVNSRPSVTNLPFGEGPKNCIGARFGMMQARVGLVASLRNYEYELSPKLELPLKIRPASFTTTISGGVWLKVKRIK